MRHFLLFILLTGGTYFISAQECHLVFSGKVVDLDDDERLEFATVYVMELSKGVQADAEGKFRMENLCKGNYTVKVSHLGCRDSIFKLNLEKNTKISIKLPHNYYELVGVDIQDKKSEMQLSTQAEEMNKKDIQLNTGSTLSEMLRNTSGVSELKTGSTISKPMIHGMQGYRVLILNNGIRLEGQQWGNEHAPEIDPFIARKITVIKGAGSLRYGSDAIGGIILVEPDDLPDTAAINGEISASGFSNGKTGSLSGFVQGYLEKLKGFSFRVQGSLKRGGNVRTPNYFLKNTGVKEYNYSYSLAYHRKKWGLDFYYSQFNTQLGIYSGAHIGNLTDLNQAIQYGKPSPADSSGFSYNLLRPLQWVEHELIKTKIHLHTGLRSRLYATYAWQYNIRKEYDKHKSRNDSLAELNLPDLDYRITTHLGELIWEHDNIRSFRGMIGASGMYQSNVYLGRFFIPNFINQTAGLFVSERFVKHHYELEAAFRYDYKNLQSWFYENKILQSPQLIFSDWSANIGAIMKPTHEMKLLLHYNKAWRSPSVNELYSNGLHHGAASIERGDKNLKQENAHNLSLSIIQQNKIWFLNSGVYYNRISNYIYQRAGSQPELTIKGAFPVFNYRQTDADIYGADITSRLNIWNGLGWELKASAVRGYDVRNNEHLVYIPSDRIENTAFADLNLARKGKLYFAFTHQFIQKQWRVPANSDYTEPPSAYHLLNAEMRLELKVYQQNCLISFRVNNLSNTVYREYLDRFRYFSDAMGRNYQLRLTVPFTIWKKKNINQTEKK